MPGSPMATPRNHTNSDLGDTLRAQNLWACWPVGLACASTIMCDVGL